MKNTMTKKEKITYVDDGRTIADMSCFTEKKAKNTRSGSSFKEIWQTYWDATRMMFLPMLVMIGFLTVLFLIVAVLFWLM